MPVFRPILPFILGAFTVFLGCDLNDIDDLVVVTEGQTEEPAAETDSSSGQAGDESGEQPDDPAVPDDELPNYSEAAEPSADPLVSGTCEDQMAGKKSGRPCGCCASSCNCNTEQLCKDLKAACDRAGWEFEPPVYDDHGVMVGDGFCSAP